MRVAALISGGKDSCFNMMQCIAAGHQIVALANLSPHNHTEIDSYMYQSVGHEAIEFIAAAMDLPLYRQSTLGISNRREKTYEPTDDDEVEDLYKLLKHVKGDLNVEAVSVGAILSDYQRVRVENVCVRLGLTPLAYLWQRDQKELLNEMIQCEVDAVLIKVAALGLDPHKHLGRSLSSIFGHLCSMNEKYGLNVCGEGGEYETLTLDSPLYRSRIVINDSEVVLHSNDPIAPVGYLKLNRLSLEVKLPNLDLTARFSGLPLKDSDGYITDDAIDACDLVLEHGSKSKRSDEQMTDDNSDRTQENALLRQRPSAIVGADGWLWIGGVQGEGTDVREAMEAAVRTLKSILEENDQTVRDVCSISMYLSNMQDYNELNKIYCDTFGHTNPPTRACVAVPSKMPVIISAVSWAPPNDHCGDVPVERHTMHVQSRSHWAPSNIGPYSQAIRVGEFVYLAGQIGLVPGSLELVRGGIGAQCQLALRHVGRLLRALDPNVNLRDVVQGICYVTRLEHIEQARKLWEEKTNNAIVDYVVVTQLPRGALVEWHMWAHRHNNQFEYEETGKCIGNFSISIYRRWNYDNNVAACVCYLDSNQEGEMEEFPVTRVIFTQFVDYTVQKLKQGHENASSSILNLTIFHPYLSEENATIYTSYLENLGPSLVYTFVPVVRVKSRTTQLSICGIRHQ